ncbi:MAG: cobyric acid synthase [Synergistaceae bacterium]|nr:cobyric acid synthase [Synergistaceae bacterium]
MKGIMIQGTSSDSGKSFLVTVLCRLFKRDFNLRICPFKSQNMSNISYKTHDGLEMSLAQALQAKAAGLEPEVFMNPILLKPKHEKSSDIILNGKIFNHSGKYFGDFTQHEGIEAVKEALRYIEKNFEAIIIEGAGSPAEINLNAHEIVNMRIAREADVSVILVADVDRGGALASVVGTLELLGQDCERVKGIIFNKFRGEIDLFKPAVEWTENYTGVKVVGVLPFAKNILLDAEDSLSEAAIKNLKSEALITGDESFDAIADLIKNNLNVNFLYSLMSR